MEDNLKGRIAATFEAKENGVSGTIITSEDSTRALLEKIFQHLPKISEMLKMSRLI